MARSFVVRLLFVLSTLLAGEAWAGWTPLGIGDCAGLEVGRSKGALPASGRCDASMGGMSAICWDNSQQRNPALKGAGCIYRKVRAESCQGGANPGAVYRCDGFGLAKPNASKPLPPAAPPKVEKKEPIEPQPVASPTAPSSDDATLRIKVQGYLDIAAELFVAKDYSGALTELKRAQAIQDLAVVRFNIARCHEELEQAEAAIAAYRAYLAVADSTDGADVRQERARKAVAFLTGTEDKAPAAHTAPSPSPATSEKTGFAWKYVRVDDCGGEALGNTAGAQPDAVQCVAETLGYTAVCWDGVQQIHPSLTAAGCTYRTVSASDCKGGANPGLLYECASSAGSAPVATTIAAPPEALAPLTGPTDTEAPPKPTASTRPTKPPAAKSPHVWRYVGPGDCGAKDSASSKGALPAASRCDASTSGKTAVCWDGLQQRNPTISGAGCSYKPVAAASCRGGAIPGFVYECAPAGASRPPPPAATSAGPRPTSASWTYVGPGDCQGSDVGASKGARPASSRCDSSRLGTIAVCWDGAGQSNPTLKGAGCTYKTVHAESCKGGRFPGAIYRCGP
ncbi:MAG: hypothetical protein HY901_04490 [Deltaproteobacteria bacterium]|nr:hypothetical protein [Deltaproteobacteria bacterium]